MITSFENQFQVQFVVDNQDKEDRLMVVEYDLPSYVVAKDAGNDPFGDNETDDTAKLIVQIEPKPRKNEGGRLTYEVPAKALSQTMLNIRVTWIEKTSDPLRNILPTRALAWLQSNLEINAATRTKLQELIAIAQEMTKQDAALRELTSRRAEYTVEQTRIRENLRAVGASTAAAEPYLTRMSEMETAILQIIEEISNTKKQIEVLKTKRNSL